MSQTESHNMVMKSASEKGTFFYLSFKTENEFVAKNTSLIEIAQMLRKRPDKVNFMLDCRLWHELWMHGVQIIADKRK